MATELAAQGQPQLEPAPTVPAAPAQSSRRLPPWVLVVVVYLLVDLAAFWPVFPRLTHGLVGGENDFEEYVWFLAAVTHQFSHGLNPFFANSLFVPTGINLAQNTTSPLLALLAWPITAAFGPVVSANLLLLAAMPVSAAAAYVVLRKWAVWWPAAALGGLIYGFSPYMVGQVLGHVQLSFLPLPPFIALTAVAIVRGQGRPVRLGIQLGLLVTAQFLISEEIAATVLLFVVLGVVCLVLRHPRDLPRLVRTSARPTVVAVAVAVVLLAYPIWMTVAGPQHFTGATWPVTNPYHNDLLSFVVPGPLDRVNLGLGGTIRQVLGYNDPTEAAGYVGIPLLIVAAVLAWRSRRSPRVQLTVVLLVVAAVLSLGPRLAVDGHLTTFPLPFAILDHVPLADDLLPDRLAFEMDALLAALVAFGLDDLRSSPVRLGRHGQHRRQLSAVLAVALVLAVLVVTQVPDWPNGGLPETVLPTRITQAVPAGDPVAITYPYDTAFQTAPMLWQAADGMSFRLLGGYAYHPAPGGAPSIFPSIMQPPALQHFLGPRRAALYGPPLPVNGTLEAASAKALKAYDVRLVIVDSARAGAGPVVQLFTDVLGRPTVTTGTIDAWVTRPPKP